MLSSTVKDHSHQPRQAGTWQPRASLGLVGPMEDGQSTQFTRRPEGHTVDEARSTNAERLIDGQNGLCQLRRRCASHRPPEPNRRCRRTFKSIPMPTAAELSVQLVRVFTFPERSTKS